MSIRPTSIYNCGQLSVKPVVTYQNYVIIGNTSLATLYTQKLIATFEAHGITNAKIYILTSGVDQTSNVNAIESLSYVATNARLILRDLEPERIHNILTSTDYLISSAERIYELYYNQYFSSGPLGDSITSYIHPMVGPWFTYDTKSNIQHFLKGWTTKLDLKSNGFIVMNRLALQLGLRITDNIIATKPTILNTNYIFVEKENNNFQRQIFYSEFMESKTHDYVQYVNRVNNIYVEESNSTCYKNVYYSTTNAPNTVPLENACLLWANNLYSYVHILGASDAPYSKIKSPVFYRYVVAIPKVNPITRVDLSNPDMNDKCLGDGVTTRLTFTCNDPPQLGTLPNMSINGSLQWDVSVYTTDDDLGDSAYFMTGGQFANPCTSPTGSTRCPCLPNQTLLIVEATSLNNRRTLAWDELNLSVSSSLNSNSIELDTYLKFELLCAQVYLAYTGAIPEIDLTGVSCTVNNICNESFPINHTATRESPQTLVLRMLTSLYGGSTYPVLNTQVSSINDCCIKIN